MSTTLERAAKTQANRIPQPKYKTRGTIIITALMTIMLGYALVPVWWLVVNASKTNQDLFTTPGLVPGSSFALFDNIAQVFTEDGGIFVRWMGNTLLYVVLGTIGVAVVSSLAGYGAAKFKFPGRAALFVVILGALAVPGSALAVPTFLLFSQLQLTNTIWAVILPSMISPFAFFLIWVYARDAVPDEVLEAARIDGAGEFRIFSTIALRIMAPVIITVVLFAFVSNWNNYFLPYIMLNDNKLAPLTIGLAQWNASAVQIGGKTLYNIVIAGSLVTVLPIAACFLTLQRYWKSGLTTGAVK
ncbi:MAG TPA: carbohydrate ABC transporter permease [Candidatus Lumbricidophila sp.]|nr:carbohydrate ABC transporter permease [Candidatus Lumbricidophila sp.]